MDLFGGLTLVGGLALFLYRMSVMGGGHSVFFGNDCYGSGICKFRYYEIIPGNRNYYGTEYRNLCNGNDFFHRGK